MRDKYIGLKVIQTIQASWQKFSDNWLVYEADDPALGYKGYLVSFISLIFAGVNLFMMPIWLSFFGSTSIWVQLAAYLSSLLFFFCYFLTRKGYANVAGLIIAAFLLTLACMNIFVVNPGLNNIIFTVIGFLMLAIVVVLVGLLVGTKPMFVMAIMTGVLGGGGLVLNGNTRVLGALSVGISYLVLAWLIYLLLQQVQSVLAQSRAYAFEVEKSRDTLASEIAIQTDELQRSFDLTSQVSAITNSSPTLEELFRRTVELIQRTFNFYHIHIYIYDPDAEELIMAYGSGLAGQRLQEQTHIIKLDQGIVGRVAKTNRPMIINNVDLFPNFLPNPLLPDTQAEMAVPVSTGSKVLAVLDIQNNWLDSFTEADQNLMQSLANQLAVAINNIQLVTETQRALANVEALNARLIQEKWDHVLQHTPATGYVYSSEGVTPLQDEWLPSMQQALTQEAATSQEPLTSAGDQYQELAIPIKLRGQLIGVLGLERKTDQPWSEDDKAVIQAVTEQIALALESARLFEDTQRNAWRDQLVGEMTAQVWSSAEIEEVLRTAVAQLGDGLDASEVVIRLGMEEDITKI